MEHNCIRVRLVRHPVAVRPDVLEASIICRVVFLVPWIPPKLDWCIWKCLGTDEFPLTTVG